MTWHKLPTLEAIIVIYLEIDKDFWTAMWRDSVNRILSMFLSLRNAQVWCEHILDTSIVTSGTTLIYLILNAVFVAV